MITTVKLQSVIELFELIISQGTYIVGKNYRSIISSGGPPSITFNTVLTYYSPMTHSPRICWLQLSSKFSSIQLFLTAGCCWVSLSAAADTSPHSENCCLLLTSRMSSILLRLILDAVLAVNKREINKMLLSATFLAARKY